MGRLSRERTNRTQSRDGKPIPYFFTAKMFHVKHFNISMVVFHLDIFWDGLH